MFRRSLYKYALLLNQIKHSREKQQHSCIRCYRLQTAAKFCYDQLLIYFMRIFNLCNIKVSFLRLLIKVCWNVHSKWLSSWQLWISLIIILLIFHPFILLINKSFTISLWYFVNKTVFYCCYTHKNIEHIVIAPSNSYKVIAVWSKNKHYY